MSTSEALIAGFQQRAGLEPPTGEYAALLRKLSDSAFDAIKTIELELSGIRDGDGCWHGSDVVGGTLSRIADLAKRALEASTPATTNETFDWPPTTDAAADEHLPF